MRLWLRPSCQANPNNAHRHQHEPLQAPAERSAIVTTMRQPDGARHYVEMRKMGKRMSSRLATCACGAIRMAVEGDPHVVSMPLPSLSATHRQHLQRTRLLLQELREDRRLSQGIQ